MTGPFLDHHFGQFLVPEFGRKTRLLGRHDRLSTGVTSDHFAPMAFAGATGSQQKAIGRHASLSAIIGTQGQGTAGGALLSLLIAPNILKCHWRNHRERTLSWTLGGRTD